MREGPFGLQEFGSPDIHHDRNSWHRHDLMYAKRLKGLGRQRREVWTHPDHPVCSQKIQLAVADEGSLRMARYYFDIREGEEFAPDDEGLDLSTPQAVQEEAARSLADMARDAIRKSSGAENQMAIEVRDENGPVFEVKFTYQIDRHRKA